jgi:hypothetical protein
VWNRDSADAALRALANPAGPVCAAAERVSSQKPANRPTAMRHMREDLTAG